MIKDCQAIPSQAKPIVGRRNQDQDHKHQEEQRRAPDPERLCRCACVNVLVIGMFYQDTFQDQEDLWTPVLRIDRSGGRSVGLLQDLNSRTSISRERYKVKHRPRPCRFGSYPHQDAQHTVIRNVMRVYMHPCVLLLVVVHVCQPEVVAHPCTCPCASLFLYMHICLCICF